MEKETFLENRSQNFIWKFYHLTYEPQFSAGDGLLSDSDGKYLCNALIKNTGIEWYYWILNTRCSGFIPYAEMQKP